jgi:hypothetical protein
MDEATLHRLAMSILPEREQGVITAYAHVRDALMDAYRRGQQDIERKYAQMLSEPDVPALVRIPCFSLFRVSLSDFIDRHARSIEVAEYLQGQIIANTAESSILWALDMATVSGARYRIKVASRIPPEAAFILSCGYHKVNL